MNHSEQINELMTALAKAQGQMKAAIKDSTNPHFRSKYADLAGVWDACREPLANNGLAITQTMDACGDIQVLITTLGHTSGQWIKSIMRLPIQKPGPQELGSCLTYCRRYSLAAMVGVFQDDDDGEKAQQPYREPAKPLPSVSLGYGASRPVEYKQEDIRIGDDQKAILKLLADELPTTLEFAQERFNFKSLDEIKQSDFDHIMKVFQVAKKKKGNNEAQN